MEILQAQLDVDTETFGDLIGACAHASGFGELQPLTLLDHMRLIRAALRASRSETSADDSPSEATG